MLSQIVKPTKSQLVKNIQSLRNPKIEVYEIMDVDNKNKFIKSINNLKTPYSIILVRN